MGAGVVILKQIVIMFIILLIGLWCSLKGLITKEGNKQLSKVALYIVNPLLIFMSYQSEYSSKLLRGLMWSFLLSGITFGVAIALSTLLISKKRPEHSLERFSAVYSNCGFIGIPLIRGIYGDEGVLYLTAYITLFNILVWTHGYMTMKESRDFKSFIKAATSPSVIAVFVGLIFYLMQIRLPEILHTSLQYVSDMNTPLAMLIAGSAAAQTNVLKALKNKGLYMVCAYKLFLLPIVAFALVQFLPAPHMVKMVVLIASACPVATTGTMFAIQFDKNPERCSEFFAVSTLLSGLTLPLVTMLGEMF
ncbi:malate transporter [Ruminococcus albus SY3]|uniref:Malate transporter n=1 Tax=Ruminococcus albus SY3 TaxID=1341156 RepID=A0A011WR30_RUMAL|nr:AEC family transporter [Ruminococcus albus]EXM39450.1 malate transporter [Ruminococcus albus SY3]